MSKQTREEYLDDKYSEAQWDHAYADASDRMEKEEEARLEAAYNEALADSLREEVELIEAAEKEKESRENGKEKE